MDEQVLKLTVVGEPVPKGRPRLDRRSGHVYTPKTTRDYEVMLSVSAMAARVRFGSKPVCVKLLIYTGTTKVDCDNVLKSVLDSLQTAQVFENDNQVSEFHVYRIQSARPRVELEVTEAEQHSEPVTG